MLNINLNKDLFKIIELMRRGYSLMEAKSMVEEEKNN